jgi:hypothetical protein
MDPSRHTYDKSCRLDLLSLDIRPGSVKSGCQVVDVFDVLHLESA